MNAFKEVENMSGSKSLTYDSISELTQCSEDSAVVSESNVQRIIGEPVVHEKVELLMWPVIPKDHVSMPEGPQSGDASNSNEDPASAEITLSELVSGIIHASTARRENDSNSLANDRFISNRTIFTRNEAPRSSVPSSEDPMGPFDVDLDSTSETLDLSSPPFTYVSAYIGTSHLINVLT